MIKRANCMDRELKEYEQGGNGIVEIKHIFKLEELKGNASLCAVILINPGCSIGSHQHNKEEEIYYIIRGQGLIMDNGVKETVGAGDSHLTIGGAYHSIENIGKEPLEFLAVIFPC